MWLAAGRVLMAAIVGLICVAGGTAAIELLGAGTPADHSYTAAPPGCVEAWNGDGSARSFGRHLYGFHRYRQVEIAMISADGYVQLSSGAPGAQCANVLAANSLDPEFAAAAMIKGPTAWTPAQRNRYAEPIGRAAV